MRFGLRRRFRFGIVAIALAAAAAGLAYAAVPDSNGVYTVCIVKTTGAVRVIDPSLPASDARSHCNANEAQRPWNQQGQPGPAGPAGPPGPAGPISNYEVRSNAASVAPGVSVQINCLAGESVIGGGADVFPRDPGTALVTSRPTASGTTSGWEGAYTSTSTTTATVDVYAICAAVAP
jgi:hypothetical protein